MANKTETRTGFGSNVLRTLRRAVGTDSLVATLQQQLVVQTEALNLLGHQLAQEVQRQAAHLDTRAMQQFEHLQQQVTVEIHRNTSLLDTSLRALDDRLRDMDTRLHATIAENRVLQNMAFSRDTLPPAALVKQYYLQLQSAQGAMTFEDVGFSVFSQNNEDGILLHIFARIGMASRRSIEIGCDLTASTVGIPEGNTINLITNFAFDGLVIDIDPTKTASIQHFFARCLATKHLHAPSHGDKPAGYFSPALVTREVTVDNINAIFGEAGFTGDIDLLSIDVDSADVSIWRAVDIVNARVVIIEINARLPFDAVVYGGLATCAAPEDSLDYQASRSSSLAAACEVGAAKGYVFVGMDATLLNAFFVRRDAWVETLPERQPADYLRHRMNPLLHI